MDSEENLTTEIKKHDKRMIDLTGQKIWRTYCYQKSYKRRKT